MKSDFEKRAAQEVVDAVERRYQRGQALARKMRGRKRFGRFVVGAAVAIAIIWGWQHFSGNGAPSFSSLPSVSSVQSLFGGGSSLSRIHQHYGEALKILLTGQVGLSSEMPETLKIKTAKPGTRYAILTPSKDGWFGLYELTRGGEGKIHLSELSPVRDAKQVAASDLRAACAGQPYLVCVQERVYLFGSQNLADAERLRRRVRALAQTR